MKPKTALYPGRALALAAALVAVAAVLASGVIPCAFASMTGLPCPACGSTRAVRALARGDLAGVLATNPLGPLVALALAAIGVQAVGSVLRRGDLADAVGPRTAALVIVLAVAELALWIARFFGAFAGPVSV